MGSYFSSLWNYMYEAEYDVEEEDKPDPITGLTRKQIRLILKSWEHVQQDPKKYGLLLFIEAFKKYPKIQKKFPDFVDKHVDELHNSPKLRAHGSTVINAFTSYIKSLDDTECLMILMQNTGKQHYHRGIPHHMFEDLGVTILTFLENQLGPKIVDEETIKAWSTALKAISSVIKMSYEAEDGLQIPDGSD